MRSQLLPPKLARKLFEFTCGPAYIDDLLGDLDELFHEEIQSKSLTTAKLNYWRRIISLSTSYALRKRKRDARNGMFATNTISFDMLKSYFKVALRNLYQYKYFSVINAFGLAIGMSISLLLIALYSFVSTYDRFHNDAERIFTVTSSEKEGTMEEDFATAPLSLADRLEKELPGIEHTVRIVKQFDTNVKLTQENVVVRTYFTEPSFFSVFSFDLIQGHGGALLQPRKVILTESCAKRLFGGIDVVGKSIELVSGVAFEVAGLMKDHPNNTHLSFEMLASLSSLPPSSPAVKDQWDLYRGEYVYFKLAEGQSVKKVNDWLRTLSNEVSRATGLPTTFATQNLVDITMGPDLRQAIGTKWEASGFLMFGVFAAMILLPACFNYTNLSIARAMRRAKEIGLRKTMGGVKAQIFLQFLTETMVITVLALGIAMIIFFVIRDEFQSMLVAGSGLDLSMTWSMAAMFFAFAVVTGVAAGIFPALHFAGLNPIEAMKNKVKSRGGRMGIRKSLTVFQFMLSFGFILSLVVFSRQYRYSLNFDFGFEKENILTVEIQDVDPQLLKNAFENLAAVNSISFSSGLPGLNASRSMVLTTPQDSVEIDQMFVDPSFIPAFGLKLQAGKNFPVGESREKFIIVNEAFLTFFKISHQREAIGQVFTVDGKELEVIGVVENFHYAPLEMPIEKFCFRSNPGKYAYANMKIVSADARQMFTDMERTWKTFSTQRKFKARYFEDELAEAYSTYQVLLKVVGFLGVLAITISLLGMLGMVVYTAEIRTKEISIRKVMGATVSGIALLLSQDYLKMMGIAILFSIPVTAFLLDTILPHIQYYHVSLTVWDVLLSVLVLVVLGMGTIVSQTYRKATLNPATTLKAE